MENADAPSHQQLADLRTAGIAVFDISPWNVYPWYTDSEPTDNDIDIDIDIERSVAALAHVIELMAALLAVLIQGTEPQRWWKSLEMLIPTVANDPRFEVVETHSAGWAALSQCSAAESVRRRNDRRQAYEKAARLMVTPFPLWRPPLRSLSVAAVEGSPE